MDLEVDVVEFRVPLENNKTILIWDILPDNSEAFIYEAVWNTYSAFGALYLVKLCPNAAVAEPGFYALVKFYSAAQASKAQRATDRRCLFQRSPLKVCLSTKTTPAFPHSARMLSHAKCQDLANHYLGFNGWSTRIITVGKLISVEAGGQEILLKYGCIAELIFPHHGVSCRGMGVAEESLSKDGDQVELLLKRGKLQKWAKSNAVVNAFERVLLLILGNGKVVVECRTDPDDILPDEDLEGIIKVNDISWSEIKNDGEEDENLTWDFTVNLSH
uniref:DM1 domain-containing protein n=1 Tax=Denticeps clupeoides TaxID=299321 RepID=A0AAY4E2I5_9TELE